MQFSQERLVAVDPTHQMVRGGARIAVGKIEHCKLLFAVTSDIHFLISFDDLYFWHTDLTDLTDPVSERCQLQWLNRLFTILSMALTMANYGTYVVYLWHLRVATWQLGK